MNLKRVKFTGLALLLTAIAVPFPLFAVTAEDFGFGNLPAGMGSKPLLLITWERPLPKTPLAHNNDFFDTLVFRVYPINSWF